MTAASRAAFQTGLTALAQFLAREGHALVPGRHVERVAGRDHRLGVWVNSRRQDFKTGWLSDERVAALEAVPGWTWNPQEAAFQIGLAALQQFVDREGHALVPQTCVERVDGRDYRLGAWVNARRVYYRKGWLSDERVAVLNAIPEWVWSVYGGVEADWRGDPPGEEGRDE